MIISKPVQAQDVISIRLSNGDEIISRYVSETDGTITISKPIHVYVQPTHEGPVMAFGPFMMTTDETGEFVINKNHLMALPTKTRGEVKANYIKATSSLDLPQSGLITP